MCETDDYSLYIAHERLSNLYVNFFIRTWTNWDNLTGILGLALEKNELYLSKWTFDL